MMTDRQYDLWKSVYLPSLVVCTEKTMPKVMQHAASMADRALCALREAEQAQVRINEAGWYERESWPKGKSAQNRFAAESAGAGDGR